MKELAADTRTMIGLDRSIDMLRQAGRTRARGVSLLTCDLLQGIPLRPASIDCCYATYNLYGTFIEADERRRFRREATRVLRPGGAIVVEVHERGGYLRRFAERSEAEIPLTDGVCHLRARVTGARTVELDLHFELEGDQRRFGFEERHLLRLFDKLELEGEFLSDGLIPLEWFANWLGDEYGTVDSERIIVVCQRDPAVPCARR